MAELFDGYDYIMADSSYFVKELPKQTKKSFSGKTLTGTASYNDILFTFSRFRFKMGKKFLYGFALNNRAYTEKNYINMPRLILESGPDMWLKIYSLKKKKPESKIILLTGDYSLMYKLVNRKVELDIYNIHNDYIITSGKGAIKAKGALSGSDFDLTKHYRFTNNIISFHGADTDCIKAKSGTVLYKKDGSTIVLSEKITEDEYSTTFRMTNDMFGKILRKSSFSATETNHLTRLAAVINPKDEKSWVSDFPWVNAPIDLLYYDKGCTSFAGYTEKAWRGEDLLSADPLIASPVESAQDKRLGTTLIHNIDICLKIALQTYCLRAYGILVSDYRPENFVVDIDSRNLIQMLNVYNFGYINDIPTNSYMEETVREYDLKKYYDAARHSDEALHHFVFSMLTLGDTPIEKGTRKFRYSDPEYPYLYRKELVPENLWNLLEKTFTDEWDFSTERLLSQLYKCYDLLIKKPAENKTYSQLLGAALANKDRPVKLPDRSSLKSKIRTDIDLNSLLDRLNEE